MIINILASHRFHLLDLARELAELGHDVRFYSYVPARRCADFGMDKACCCSLLWLVWPFFLLAKIAPQSWQSGIVWYRNLLLDGFLSLTMRRCDVCIGLGTVYLKAFEKAKQQGARTILEWGSKHIIEQQTKFGTLDAYPKRVLNRELKQYEICDFISIPAEHVKESFLKHGIAEEKLLVNPYGVDLSQFHPTECSGDYDLIFVGGWRYEKGCDLLTELCQKEGYSLLHVGAIVNLPFPDSPNLKHHDPVDQSRLIDFYAKAKVFVIPSRAEGLAMVQAQALACGLPVVCSKETGGRDLGKVVSGDSLIYEMDSVSLVDLSSCVRQAIDAVKGQFGVRGSLNSSIQNLSWEKYGRRYIERISST